LCSHFCVKENKIFFFILGCISSSGGRETNLFSRTLFVWSAGACDEPRETANATTSGKQNNFLRAGYLKAIFLLM